MKAVAVVLTSVFVTAVGVAAYHALAAKPPADDSKANATLAQDVRVLRAEFERLRADLLKAARVGNPAPAPAGDGSTTGLPATKPPTWTDEQVATMRSLMEEVERRREQERETEGVKRRLDALSLSLSPAETDRVLGIALDYTRQAREVVPRNALAMTPEERQAALDKRGQLRSDLEATFRGFLPPETVEKLMKAFPEVPRGPTMRGGPVSVPHVGMSK
jgi:hypothetical protein